ncbi:phage antirepressor protein, partial [Candidatus Woesearchaeota archaeon CG_4_10_14_0_8_um_filter_47_5]
EVETKGGKQRMNCANTKGVFRIIQSIPSKRAEPFKLWLAKLGQERIEEIENPELAQDRVKEYYELKGYPKDWIDKRLRGIAVRQDLTDEWKQRGIEKQKDFAILTNEIHEATFDISIQNHKELKNLPKKSKTNLRDHMTDLELIFTMLGEASTTEIAKKRDSQGFVENKLAAEEGGKIAGDARKKLELKTSDKIVGKENFLDLKQKKKKELE